MSRDPVSSTLFLSKAPWFVLVMGILFLGSLLNCMWHTFLISRGKKSIGVQIECKGKKAMLPFSIHYMTSTMDSSPLATEEIKYSNSTFSECMLKEMKPILR